MERIFGCFKGIGRFGADTEGAEVRERGRRARENPSFEEIEMERVRKRFHLEAVTD